MTRNQRIQTTAHHLRRIYQSGVAVAMRVGAIKRNHANAMTRIGCAVGNSWDEAVRMAQAMAFAPPLAVIAAAGATTGMPAHLGCVDAMAVRYGNDDGRGSNDWIESARANMAGRAARSAGVRLARRLGLILLALLVGAWLTGVGK